ncbi:uncharacterized protein LOC109704510 isoform X2 [Ananas comosus]|nr:uncharacterized protein LOC109704510 isoform X2 [Ananas comosus]
MLLELLIDAFPEGTSLPRSTYEAKKVIKALGLSYEKIHCCPNDCLLFLGEKANDEVCHVCGSSRWVIKKQVDKEKKTQDEETNNVPIKKKKAAKVLRYFPLIPRLQRLFVSTKTAKDMRWHEEGRVKDGLLRHPADGKAWRAFDERYPDFSSDSRNVRLGLASDGFNPFRTMNTTYSTWPVVVIPYNLPSWICMKQSNFILSMIIPGEKSPGNDIDIFLQPLIDELKQLWGGVDTYDASTGQTFHLRAMLMWTINDFPAYGNLSGWSTKGKYACPCCAENTHSKWLYNGRKYCYMGHRRWLPEDHTFRYQKYYFDGSEELRMAPEIASGSNVLGQLESVKVTLGKLPNEEGKFMNNRKKNKKGKRKRKRQVLDEIGESHEQDLGTMSEARCDAMKWWKKKSIFFTLPYWEHNLIRHNLDVMHIEKNVFDNFIGTFLNLDKKSKDNLQARLDLIDLGIRPELHPQILANGKRRLPPACFTMSMDEKRTLCQVLKDLKMPDSYASNISRCVNLKECKITGLKSHDCHILVEDILPLALRACSPSNQVTFVVTEVANFFKAICSKVLDVDELDKIQNRIVLTLCHMERIFLPSFFTIMVHLCVHLVDEIKLGGPVQYRWMYPQERFFVRLKSYVRNRAHPEGSIAEGYIAEECLTFCSRYLDGVETRFNRPVRNPDPLTNEVQRLYLFSSAGRAIGKVEDIVLDDKSWVQAHRYVLRHCDEIQGFRQQFIDMEKRKRRRHTHLTAQEIENLVNEKFHEWFDKQVMKADDSAISEKVATLGRGPNKVAKRFSGFIINGFRYHTISREENMLTQNSGVVNTSEIDGVNYYGRLRDIIELNYYGSFKVVLFKCDWVDVHHSSGIKQDEFGFTSVNFSRLIHTGEKLEHDPYVFSSQVEQVFYVQDPHHQNWFSVVKFKPRDFFDMGKELGINEASSLLPPNVQNINEDEHPNWIRIDASEDDTIGI